MIIYISLNFKNLKEIKNTIRPLSRSVWENEAAKKFSSFLLGSKSNTPDILLRESPPPIYNFNPTKMNNQVLIENL